jgi:membrane-bound lytic murein transglycosylase B
MGYGQFMPSSFKRFAVDFDGDGRRDLWDVTDAIGSVANYFREHGWRTGDAVTVSALARGREPQLLKADYTTRYSLEDLARSGVTPSGALAGAGEVSLLRLDAVGGYDYWLGLPNFYVITRYNHSTYYAMAVHQLAEALRARHERLYGPVRSARREGPPGPAM